MALISAVRTGENDYDQYSNVGWRGRLHRAVHVAGQRWCQSNANQSPNLQMMRISRRQLTPFGERGGAVLLECVAAVEMTAKIKMIVNRSVGR